MKKLTIIFLLLLSFLLLGCNKKEEVEPEEEKIWVEVKVIDYFPRIYIEHGYNQEIAYLVVEKDGKKYCVRTNIHPLSVQLVVPKNRIIEVEEKELKPYAGWN